jgi:RloB-like protein
LDSRIRIEVYRLKSNEDNSPQGLLDIAHTCLVKSDENPNPKYELLEEDEVWFVIDTDPDKNDSRKPQIQALRRECKSKDWYVAQSNPCFEVWLYYHFYAQKPNFDNIIFCHEWKQFLHKEIGGFDSKRHPIVFEKAIINAENVFAKNEEGLPDIATTEVFNLSKIILPLVKRKIDVVLRYDLTK